MSDLTPALSTLLDAGPDAVLSMRSADVGLTRERRRTRRWVKLTVFVLASAALISWRASTWDGSTSFVPYPHIDPFLLTIIIFFGLLMFLGVGQQVMSGRSPHVTYRPEQISVGLDDVVGIDGVKDDVVRSLNLFLAHTTFSEEMGGTPRRGLLFEGAPGTGKTHLARAMAREAGVPFLFVSATSFQSMWYGATAKKIRSYFKELRKAARKEGGAIGFIEEIDAIAMSRGGVATGFQPVQVAGCYGTASLPSTYAHAATLKTPFVSEGTGGVVNEMLVQMQSFDALTGWQRLGGWCVDRVNLFLPVHRQLKRPQTVPTNVLLIAATNRADSLDPALLRPGRFDRRLIATHEAGHATLAWLTAPERRLEILTIVKRRSALGMLAHGDREDVFTRSRSELQALIQIAMGGQCAEEIFFGDVSTGPGGDLLYATNCAAEMVGAHGMNDSLVSYMAVQNSSFSDTNIVGRVLHDDRGRDAVEALLQVQKATAKRLLLENRHLVEALRDALLDRHELIGHEITDVLEAASRPAVVDLRASDAVVD
ncbi:MAG: AAA family ATPase [Actinobacteria bacterium]|nr:AAA family ATPase [Actinomycetota bacterium]